jgi:hypothetical protein
VERTVVAEAREVVCESSPREPRELLFTDALDLAPVAGEATENHQRGKEPEPEQERESGQLRELEVARRPVARAPCEYRFCAPSAESDGEP